MARDCHHRSATSLPIGGAASPYALPAIACGVNGLLVIDLDRHPNGSDGVSAFKALVEQHGGLPPGVPMVKTPNNGLHLYFRQPPGEPLGNGRGSLPAGCDVRGVGGYVIGPGAVLPDGRGWIAVANRPPITQPAQLGWIESILRRPAKPLREDHPAGETSDQRGRAYAEQALHEIEAELAVAKEGERNERLYKAAFRLGTMAARNWIDAEEIISGLMRASATNGYQEEHGHRPTMTTIESGMQDGMKLPHPDLEVRDHQRQKTGDAEREQPKQKRQRETGTWDEPDTSLLDDRRGELPEFLDEALGVDLVDWLRRSARGAGVTTCHVATPMLAAASSLIGAGRRIQPSRSWSEPLTLWTAVVGFSGTGKTPGADVTLRALALIEQNRRAEVEALQRKHETKVETAKAARKAWEKAVQEAVEAGLPPPPKPAEAMDVGRFVTPRLFASNVTVERWAALLQARPSGMFMFRDELAGHFLNMSRYTNGQDNEFWLEAFNGKHYVVERQSAPAINIPHLLIGICGGLQPDKLARSFEGDDDGMYTRICFAWPSAAAYRPLSDDVAELEPELVNAFGRLASLPCTDADGNLVSRTVWLSDEARAEFEQFRQFLHLDLDKLDGREREWWSKGPTHVLRLAGTLAYLGWAWIGGPEPERVEALYVRNAVRLWTHYYWPHARAALRLVGQSDKHADARRVLRWLEASGMDELSIKDVRRDALGQKLNAEHTLELIELLVRAGWLREITVKGSGPGRPARRWEVNPSLSKAHT